MPKRSSKFPNSISPAREVMKQNLRKWFWIFAILIPLTVSVYFFIQPKRLSIEAVAPSGATVFLRLDHVYEHLESFRSSEFWKSVSQLDLPKLFAHESVESKKIQRYNRWRDDAVGILENPLFKELMGKEAAAALYPQLDGFSNGNWPKGFSGVLVMTRLNSKVRVAESLGNIWNQYSQKWETRVSQYKNIPVVAIKLESPNPTVYYARIADLLVVGVDERMVHAAIDTAKQETPALDKDAKFLGVRQRLYTSVDALFFADVPKVREFFEKYWDELFEEKTKATSLTRGKVREFLHKLDGITAAGGAFVYVKPMQLKWVVDLDPAKITPELKRLSQCQASENKTAGFVPKDAIAYQWTGCADFPSYYKKLKALRQKEGGANPFGGLEKTWNLNVEKDILPVLGREVGWYIQGFDVSGLFPIPQLVFFLKVNDDKAAQSILRKIVTTPVTMVQSEDYQNNKMNVISFPLVSLKPGYAFFNGYVLISTSDKLIKQSIDAAVDPAKGLAAEGIFKDLNTGERGPSGASAVSFIKIGEIARQSRAVVDWADQWFSLKVGQANTDEEATRARLQALQGKIEAKQKEVTTQEGKLTQTRKEQESIAAQAQVSALGSEAKGALAQPWTAQKSADPSGNQPLEALELKKSQAAALQMEIDSLKQDTDALKSQTPELQDALDDFEKQKTDAQNFRYYVDDVVAPILHGLEFLTAQWVRTMFKDNAIESEMFLKVQ